MSLSLLRLPTDIPWVRVCVSEDMLDKKICDKVFPPKWHSSVAVFRYTPDEEYQLYKDYQVIYFKVAVTITGYQPRDAEIEGKLDWNRLTTETIDAVDDLLNEYHPCTGAIIQVLVAPSGTDVANPRDYPYFLDFEPKKRELYEMATDTKEKMSRSLEDLNLGKSTSSAQSQEVLDIDMGGSTSFGMSASYAGTGGGFNYGSSTSGQWGTKQVGSNEAVVTRATDQGTERRETSSFSTQITQMYHQLDSYHLGTNRVIFFVQPRPHTLEEPSGFVRGPRPVEGIQEFFMVVLKPKAQKDVCLSVRIDTAHLAEVPIMDYDYKKDSLELAVSVPPPESNDPQAVYDGTDEMPVTFLGADLGNRHYRCYRKRVEQVNNYTSPWADYKVDVGDNGGYAITAQNASYGDYSVDVAPDGSYLAAKVWATSRKCFNSGGAICVDCPDTWHARSANSSLALVVNLISREAIRQTGTEQVLLVTTRGLCCCGEEHRIEYPGVISSVSVPWLIAQKGASFGLSDSAIARTHLAGPVPLAASAAAGQERLTMLKTPTSCPSCSGKGPAAAPGGTQSGSAATQLTVTNPNMTARQANALSSLFRTELMAAVAPGRPEGREPLPYVLHDVFLRKLEARLRPYQRLNKTAEKPLANRDVFKSKKEATAFFGKDVAELTNRDLARASTQDVARVAGVSLGEAAQLRLGALGIPVRPEPKAKSTRKSAK